MIDRRTINNVARSILHRTQTVSKEVVREQTRKLMSNNVVTTWNFKTIINILPTVFVAVVYED